MEDAFRSVFKELFPMAYRVAWRIVGDVTTAEDCAAEALARAFIKWKTVEKLPHRDAWVLRVAANLAIDTTRKRKAVPETSGFTPGFEDASATRLALAAALGALPRRQRDVIVLRHLHGYSETEVAEALGLAHGTVKTHLRRALESMRRRLGEDFGRTANVV